MAILLKLQKIQRRGCISPSSILCDDNMHIAKHYSDNINGIPMY